MDIGNQQNYYLQREYEFCELIKKAQDEDEQKNKLNSNVLRIIDCLDCQANQSKISCQSSTEKQISLYDCMQEKYIITEYCNSSSLYEYLTNKGFLLQMTEVLDTSLQIAQGLKFLHDLKIMHRDLKPENIFVHKEKDKCIFKIGDFGIVNTFQLEGIEQSFVGTINYMSPELIKKQNYSKEIDYWSLGCIIYEINKGYQRFRGNTEKDVIQKIINSRSQCFKFSQNQPLENIIQKCLLRSQEGGYENIKQIIEELEDLLTQKVQQEKQQLQQKQKLHEQSQIQYQLQNYDQLHQQIYQQYQNQQICWQQNLQQGHLQKQEQYQKNAQTNKFYFSKSPISREHQGSNLKQHTNGISYKPTVSQNYQEYFLKINMQTDTIKQEPVKAVKFEFKNNMKVKNSNNSNLAQENQDKNCNTQSINFLNSQQQQIQQVSSNSQNPQQNQNLPKQNSNIQEDKQKQHQQQKLIILGKNQNKITQDKSNMQNYLMRLNNHKQNSEESNDNQQQQNLQISRGSSCGLQPQEETQAKKQDFQPVQNIKARSISQNKQYGGQNILVKQINKA